MVVSALMVVLVAEVALTQLELLEELLRQGKDTLVVLVILVLEIIPQLAAVVEQVR
jgi:hypothetical protein